MVSSPTPVHIPIRNILLPTDFSTSSERALAYGACMARRFGATLNIVTVVPEEIVDYVQPPDPFYLRHSAQKKMAHLADEEVLQDIVHREFVEDGQISERIPTLMDWLDIDLLVLAVHIRNQVKQLVIGSAAEEIIHVSPCSVIAVGPNARKPATSEWNLQRILYATDLRAGSGEALAYCFWLGERDHAHLSLLHVQRALSQNGIHSDGKKFLEQIARLLPPDTSLETELIVDGGDPREQILKNAESRDVDLIVLGPCDAYATWTSTHLPWAISHQVICRAHCPVLTVHRSGWNQIERYS